MEGIEKSTWIVIGLALAAILGVFVFTKVNTGMESGNQAMSKIEAMNTQMAESEYTQYDGAVVTGSQVLQVIRMNKEKGVTVEVRLFEAAGTVQSSGETYTPGETDYDTKVRKARTKGEDTYITPAASFLGKIERSATTKEINKLIFEIQD